MSTTVVTKSSIKVAGAVSATATAGNIYTCSANSYAIVNVSVTAAVNAGTITVAGQAMIAFGVGQTFPSANLTVPNVLYVGPGQTVAVTGTSNVGRVTGVELVTT